MGRSIARLPELGAPPAGGERRRFIRQKLYTPVYASFNGPQTGVVVDLSELLDLSEEGFAVQTAMAAPNLVASDEAANSGGAETSSPTSGSGNLERLQVNQHVSLCLDLPETKSLVHGTGQVIWCDDMGRAGIRFSTLAPDATQKLKQWLFGNLLIGSANYSARKEQLAGQGAKEHEPSAATIAGTEGLSTGPVAAPELAGAASSHRAELLSALDELRNQIRRITTGQAQKDAGLAAGDQSSDGASAGTLVGSSDRTEAVLQLIAENAIALTGASGAALALQDDGGMICRASAGDPAPPLGSHVDVSRGLSGECVRTMQPIVCHDTESDRRVDAELCRSLGIGSLIAVPVLSEFRVVGLFEVFSPKRQAFSSDETITLQRLAELVPIAKAVTGAVETRKESQISQNEPATVTPQGGCELDASRVDAREGPTPMAVDQPKSTDEDAVSDAAEEATPLDHLRVALWDRTSHLAEEARHAASKGPTESNFKSPDFSSSDIKSSDLKSFDLKSKTQAEARGANAVQSRASEVEDRSDEASDDELETAADEISDKKEQQHDSDSELSGSASPIRYLGLLLSSLAVVALALGYLLAPVIERHLNSTTETAQASGPAEPAQGASVTRTVLTVENMRKLAEDGDAEAQFTLGTLYRNGDGVLQNDSQAIEWFQRAADQGHPLALRALGSAYWGGRGVPQNYSRAYFWYELALAMGDQQSKSSLEGLATQMTQRQVTDARQQAEAWLQAHNQPPKTASN